MSTRVVALYRKAFLLAVGVVIACIPWLWLAERYAWSQRPIHWVQTFLAVPAVWVASAGFLWFGRTEPGARPARALRVFAWFVWFIATLWLAFLAYVLWFADFSWMNQR
jgi:hypothetical protein